MPERQGGTASQTATSADAAADPATRPTRLVARANANSALAMSAAMPKRGYAGLAETARLGLGSRRLAYEHGGDGAGEGLAPTGLVVASAAESLTVTAEPVSTVAEVGYYARTFKRFPTRLSLILA